MIKAEINKGETSLGMSGDIFELLADVSTIVHAVHVSVCGKSVIDGMIFESVFRKSMDMIFQPFPGDEELVKEDEG